MKNTFTRDFARSIVIASLALSFGSVGIVYAETATSDTNAVTREKLQMLRADIEAKQKALKEEQMKARETIKTDRTATREAVKTDREQAKEVEKTRREEAKKKLEERRIAQIKNELVHAAARLEARIETENATAGRIASRLEKIKANGKDVSSAEMRLDAAKVKIEAAKTDIASAKSAGASIAAGATKDVIEAVKTALKKAEASVKDAHNALVQVVVSLKGVSETTKTAQ